MEKKRRGRPPKSETGETRIIINDPLLEPFYIEKDKLQFVLLEKSTATRGFAGKAATGKETTNVIGYYTSLGNAVKKVASLKTNKKSTKYNSLQEYITSLEEVKEHITQLTNSLNSKL